MLVPLSPNAVAGRPDREQHMSVYDDDQIHKLLIHNSSDLIIIMERCIDIMSIS